MAMMYKQANWLLGLAGAIGGGALGYFAFHFLARDGLYAMVLPGALLGLGCGALSGGKSTALGVVCGSLALVLGIVLEWQLAPFVADDSFPYFVTHIHELTTSTLVMIALGGLFGFWFGKGREGGAWLRRRAASE